MPTTANNPAKKFVVKESKTWNLIVGIFFLVSFGLILFNFLNKETVYTEYANYKLSSLLICTAAAAIGFMARGLNQTIIITINQNGIYVLGELKTNWKNFINAEATKEQVKGYFQTNLTLLIQYYKDSEDGVFETKIPMLDTYNKSGEEVIEAIKKFMQPANVEA